MRYIHLLGTFFSVMSMAAQIPVGHWRTHFSYTNTTKVLDTPEAVYGISTKDMVNGTNHNEPYQKGYFTANNAALFVYDKESESTEILSRIQGLSESLCSNIAYSERHKTLVIAYDNNNIDLMIGRQIFNIPELKLKMMSVSKRINSITIHDNLAYMATDFGFVSINLLKREFVDTFVFPEGGMCYQMQYFDNYLFGFFEKGIWRCSINKNVMDKSDWEKVGNNEFVKTLIFHDKFIALSKGGQTYRYENIASGNWMLINSDTYTLMESTPKGLVLSNGASFLMYDERMNPLISANFPSRIHGMSSVGGNYLWVAGGEKGLLNYEIVENDRLELLCSQIMPAGPVRNEGFSMRSSGDKIIVTAGGSFYNVHDIPGAFYVFENDHWWSADFSKVSPDVDLVGKTKKNLVEVIEDPKRKNRFFASSWLDGLYEFIGDSCVNLYTMKNTNGVIEATWRYIALEYTDNYRIGGLSTDKQGNIWMACSLSKNTLAKVFCQNTQKFDEAIAGQRMGYMNDFQHTKSGNVWGISAFSDPSANANKALFVFNIGSSIEDKKDDLFYKVSQFIDQDNQILNIGDMLSLTLDQNNVLWVAHTGGLFAISNADASVKSVLTGSSQYRINRPKVPRNNGTNYADYLMDGQTIQSIAVDGANRKWIGTQNNGVYVVSETGTEILANYNQSNSLLLGNSVKSIAIQPSSGEVFFGTNNGICSFRSDATTPENSFDLVTVFPNPVRSDYSGLIAITGLMENSYVRITDMNGNSVNEGKSLGGQYTWNGQNYSRRKVSTGIYLVFASSNDGKLGMVAKILVVK